MTCRSPVRTRGVGVDHAEVRVEAEAGEEERVAGAAVGVEVVPVVGVAVGADHVGHRQRGLVDRVLVERVEHGHLEVGAAGVAWGGSVAGI